MNCEQIRTAIARQIAGDTADAVAAHVANCVACRNYQAETRELWKRMEPIKMELCPVGLAPQAVSRALAGADKDAAQQSGLLSQWPVLDYAVVTAAALLLFAALLQWNSSGNKPPVMPPARGVIAGNGADDTKGTSDPQNEELQKILKEMLAKLSDDNFDARQQASKEVEAFVRKQGQSAFNALMQLQHEWEKAHDAESQAALRNVMLALTSPTLQWVTQTGHNSFQSSRPTVAGDMLLLGSEEGVVAVKLQTGAKIWSAGGDFDHNVPLVVKDLVVACGRTRTSAFSLKDGAELWHGPEATQTSAVADEERIYIPANSALVATDLSGKQLWTLQFGSQLASPMVSTKLGIVFVPVWNVSLAAVNAKTGEKLWDRPLKGIGHLAPTLVNDRVYVCTEDSEAVTSALVCLDAPTGKVLWSGALPASADLQPTQSETITTTTNGRSTVTSGRIHDEREYLIGQPAIVGELAVAQAKHHIYAFSTKDGAVAWKLPCDRFGYTAFAVDGGIVYAGGDQGELRAVNAATGTVEWNVNLNELVTQSLPTLQVQRNNTTQHVLGTTGEPIVVGLVVYVTSESGATVAVRLPQFKRPDSK